jgi:mutator protein MutT
MNLRAAAIILKDEQILLFRRVKEEWGEYWVFPGGGVESNETPEQAMIREIQEELSLQVTEYELLFEVFNDFTMNQQYPPRQEYYYLVTGFVGDVRLGGEEADRISEADQYYPTWVPLARLEEMEHLKPEVARLKLLDILKTGEFYAN